MGAKTQGIVNTVQQGLSYALAMNQAVVSSVQSSASLGASVKSDDKSPQVEPNAPYSSFGKDSKDQSSGSSLYAGGPFNAITISSSDSSLDSIAGGNPLTNNDKSKDKLKRIKAQGYQPSSMVNTL